MVFNNEKKFTGVTFEINKESSRTIDNWYQNFDELRSLTFLKSIKETVKEK